MTFEKRAPLLIAALLAALAMASAFLAGQDRLEDWQLAARWTARAAFPVFLVTYAASSLLRLYPGAITRAIMRGRRQWGLGFAFVHTVHLGALVTYNILLGNMPGLTALIGGGFAYSMMFVMAFTSSDWAMRALGGNWKRLHQIGIHWLWVVFTFSYAGRIFEPETAVLGLSFTALALAALGLRIAARFRRRQAA